MYRRAETVTIAHWCEPIPEGRPLVPGYASRVSTSLEPAVRVSTLELFFDLVFVFTVTQLTAVAAGASVPDVLRVMLLLGVIWWMYGGYAWLTNAVAPTDGWRRGLLFVGMAGFLTIALAVPRAFG